MKQIEIRTKNNSYPIFLGNQILQKLKEYTKKYDHILFLTNDTLWNLYSSFWENYQREEPMECYILPDGEKYKNLASISNIYDRMVAKHFSRKSLILCFGGGVICDMGGFVGASYMRGIDVISIPSSLLAQVDASIGGKVAVNHSEGKNLIGFFYPPKAVFLDVHFLKTLPEKEWKSGMAEVIKHSILSKNEDYASFLLQQQQEIQSREEKSCISLIEQSCQIKKEYVEKDMEEKGIRAFLNFGHTYAHALEKLLHYEGISHGEAVAKGCMLDLDFAYSENKISTEYRNKIKTLFSVYGIDTQAIAFPIDSLWEAMKQDKKNAFQKINTVLLEERAKGKQFSLQEVNRNFLELYTSKQKNSYLKAVIDIGTNSCRLFIAQVDFQGKKLEKDLYREIQIVQLGENVHTTGYLQENAIERTLACLKEYRQIIDSYGCSEIYCFATSATRDAKNQDSFLKKVFDNTGISVQCISGEEEARYNFQGVSLAFTEKILIVDIGGGSTEFTLGERPQISFQKSLNIGAVRATELFFSGENYSKKNIEACRLWIEKQLQVLHSIQKESFKLVAVAGTATSQVSVREQMKDYDRSRVHLSTVSREDLQQNYNLFLSLPLEERKKIIGLEPKRANVIIAGTLILDTILNYFQIKEFIISEFDNLTGAMIL